MVGGDHTIIVCFNYCEYFLLFSLCTNYEELLRRSVYFTKIQTVQYYFNYTYRKFPPSFVYGCQSTIVASIRNITAFYFSNVKLREIYVTSSHSIIFNRPNILCELTNYIPEGFVSIQTLLSSTKKE